MEKKIGVGFGVMLLNGNEVLLGKRNNDLKKAGSELHGEGSWTMPGGKLKFGETFEDGAKREVKEETNLVLNKVRVIGINQDMVEDAHFITIGMLSEDFKGDPEVTEPDEITEWKWFPLTKLPSPFYFPSAKVLNNFKKKKFYVPNL